MKIGLLVSLVAAFTDERNEHLREPDDDGRRYKFRSARSCNSRLERVEPKNLVNNERLRGRYNGRPFFGRRKFTPVLSWDPFTLLAIQSCAIIVL